MGLAMIVGAVVLAVVGVAVGVLVVVLSSKPRDREQVVESDRDERPTYGPDPNCPGCKGSGYATSRDSTMTRTCSCVFTPPDERTAG